MKLSELIGPPRTVLTVLAIAGLMIVAVPALAHADDEPWPAVANNQDVRPFTTALAVSPNGLITPNVIITCKNPCYDEGCEAWTSVSNAVCRTYEFGQDCAAAVSQYCMKKQLQSGFWECVTCIN